MYKTSLTIKTYLILITALSDIQHPHQNITSPLHRKKNLFRHKCKIYVFEFHTQKYNYCKNKYLEKKLQKCWPLFKIDIFQIFEKDYIYYYYILKKDLGELNGFEFHLKYIYNKVKVFWKNI